jgi:hypothetical protein
LIDRQRSEAGLEYAHPSMMTLANLLSHPELGSHVMSTPHRGSRHSPFVEGSGARACAGAAGIARRDRAMGISMALRPRDVLPDPMAIARSTPWNGAPRVARR